MEIIAEDLQFPEGPIALPDGSLLLVEIARGTLSRISTDGTVSVVAELGGGPNGAAIGPDGACYVCNNGGMKFTRTPSGKLIPGVQPADYRSGSIQRVDIETGEWTTLYDRCGDRLLCGPNDLVFDREGGMWFTDHGKVRPRERDRTGVFYAMADGSEIREAIFPLEGPNGIGLSPDESTLYVAETPTGRLWSWELESPGIIGANQKPSMMAQIPDYHLFDSLAVDAAGNVCVATIVTGGITVHSADGERSRIVPCPDNITTNICFGGDKLETAYITLSGTGRVGKMPWPEGGLPLNFLNQ